MKANALIIILLFFSISVIAQETVKSDTIVPAKGNTDGQLNKIKEKKVELHSDSTGNQPLESLLIDTTLQNKYGDLLNDDPKFNKRYPIWIPAVEVLGTVALTWSFDHYILKADYSNIGFNTWKYNFKEGWEWDNDRFGVNFIGHPYSGSLTFNAGRSNGYNYLESFGFSVAGSLVWEYLCENTRPSYNDIINTPVNGAFLGEVLYRLSSNILDDRTKGGERVMREIAAGLVDPIRGLNRLLHGDAFRFTTKEVYQKEPLNISLYGGARKVNDEPYKLSGPGSYNAMFNFQFDYGNPFETRVRKPFDFFTLRMDINIGVGRKYLDNILGYGILYGQNLQLGKTAILAGVFQYYDYWDNKKFELGTIGFGGGVITKLPVNKTSNLYTRIHIAFVPFAGNSTKFGPDTSQFRDYSFGGGLETKFEGVFNLGKYATATMVYYFYMIHTYVGAPGNNFIHILKPRITVRLYKNLSIGYEYYLYYNDRNLFDYAPIHSIQTEQKVFLLFFLEDSQRRGYYN